MTVNKVILVGNLGRDPELRQTNSGTAVCNLNLATSERRKDRDGNWGDHTEWHRVVAFGKTAENAARYLAKGRQVYIEGKLSTREYTDKDGNRRWSTEVVCDVLRFLQGGSADRDHGGGRGGSAGGGYGQAGGGQAQGSSSGGYGQAGGYGTDGGGDDDIPF